MIGNIVVGIGFLGAGLIIKTNDQPHGVTTAALIWMAAAIGILVGVGLTQFAFAAAVVIAVLLYLLRRLNVSETLEKK
jgi:putative Mg2+ transporter-C (MgtC) family protein